MRKKKVRKEKVCILGICAALAVLLCAAPIVQAAEYFISPTGNDAGSGTLFSPWQSPSRGAAFRLNGLHSAGATTIAIRDSEGFLPSGNLNISGTTYAYSSKTDVSFQLVGSLAASVATDTVIQDADILSGVGYQPGDIITFRGGTWFNQRLRVKNSGSALGGYITYRGFEGEDAFLQLQNHTVNGVGPPGFIWNDGENAATKTEYLIFENLRLKTDQNLAANEAGSVFYMQRLNSTIFRNLDITATGSAGDASMGFRMGYSSGIEIYDSTIYSQYSNAVMFRQGGSLDIHHTAIGSGKYGISNSLDAEVTADHLTLVDIPMFAVSFPGDAWEFDPWPDRPSLTNSIVYFSTAASGSETLHKGSGDYNMIWNAADPFSQSNGVHWNASTTSATDGTAGANDQNVDPEFLIDHFIAEDGNRFDWDWLRFLATSPAATASDTGSWVGAFAPVIPGDVNLDGFVGGTDLTLIVNNWGMTGATRTDGDLSDNGTVDGPDYTQVISNWGNGTIPAPEPPAGVPEPGTLLLLLGGALTGLFGARRKGTTMKIILAVLLLVGLLAAPAAADVSFSWTQLSSTNIPDHYRSFDLMATVTTNLSVYEIVLDTASANSIFQETLLGIDSPPNPAFFGAIPALEFDTYVSLGGYPLVPTLAGPAEDILPGSTQTFNTEDLNVTWAVPPGGSPSGPGTFQVARITLANRASAPVTVYGWETGQAAETPTQFSGILPKAISPITLEFVELDNPSIPTGYFSYDIRASVDSNIGAMELLIDLTSGDIYQNAASPSSPNETYASFVTMGPSGPDATNTDLIGGAVDLGGGTAYTFDTQDLDITWSPSTGVQTDFGDFTIGRVTLRYGTMGTYALKVWQGEDAENPAMISGALSDFLPLPGDVNRDGWVAGGDLSIVITYWGQSVGRDFGDLNGNGLVDGPDYTEVLTYWGTGTPPEPPTGGAVPEPATLVFLFVGALAGLIRRR